MKRHIHFGLLIMAVLLTMSACNEDTGSLGIPSQDDIITPDDSIFNVFTNSLALDSILSISYTSYLGDIQDPETGTRIRADFASQFHTFENYSFPRRNLLFPQDNSDHSDDPIACDSCEIRLYFSSYFGKADNPMKLEVYPLSKNCIIEEGTDYYTNTDLAQFVESGAKPIATKVFTPADYILSDAERQSSTHTDNVRIVLDKRFGTELMEAYYAHPEYYKDSYTFIRKVCPGFYFKLKSGTGTMLSVDVGTLNIYFTFYDAHNPDSIYNGITRFAATPEVIQTTHFESDDLQQLIDTSACTFLKTPAGICTEVTLPISEIYAEHQNDSVNKAQLTLMRYNNQSSSEYSLGIPGTLLLVRKQNMYSFFANREVADSQTSYTTTFDATYNTYTFQNLCRLISYCQHEKQQGMHESGLSEAAWEAAHPDWNHVVLIPVKTNSTLDSQGLSKQVSVVHDMDMNSTRLVGGPGQPIQMQVIYSKYK
ncbi:MAG: DUF4270 domain-containing protein [Bacteroidaceae bacterium]|nr:DUF4270 domain-containing protein [Bacteroidaceae bacterium]